MSKKSLVKVEKNKKDENFSSGDVLRLLDDITTAYISSRVLIRKFQRIYKRISGRKKWKNYQIILSKYL